LFAKPYGGTIVAPSACHSAAQPAGAFVIGVVRLMLAQAEASSDPGAGEGVTDALAGDVGAGVVGEPAPVTTDPPPPHAHSASERSHIGAVRRAVAIMRGLPSYSFAVLDEPAGHVKL
jgi:hypothetical protein